MAGPYQMTLSQQGILDVQNRISTPAISLNGVDLTTTLQTIASTTNPVFTETLTVEKTGATGTSNIYLKTNNSTRTARVYMDETGLIKLDNNSITGLQVYPNGVLGTDRRVQNKLLSLYEGSLSSFADTPATATNFYGFGIASATLRYQVPTTSQFHRLYCGTTLALEVGGSSNLVNAPTGITTPAITLTGALLSTTLNDRASLVATTTQSFAGNIYQHQIYQ